MDGRRLGGLDPLLGGDRNPFDIWDFYDVNQTGDIDLTDTLGILTMFGAMPGDGRYNLWFDRTAPDSTKPWRTAAASDGIDLGDALLSLQSFGHNCADSTLNPHCPDGMTGVKFDSPFGPGTIGPITVLNVVYEGGEPKYFDWTSTVAISFVYVKASTTFLTYEYNPSAFHGEGLFAPSGPSGPRGISHSLFCWVPGQPTVTPTAGGATSTPGADTRRWSPGSCSFRVPAPRTAP